MTSDEVMPKCSQRADGPTFSATAVVNAMTSCCVVCFDLVDARDVEGAALADVARGVRRDDAGGGHGFGGRGFDRSQVSYRRWSLQMRPISGCV